MTDRSPTRAGSPCARLRAAAACVLVALMLLVAPAAMAAARGDAPAEDVALVGAWAPLPGGDAPRAALSRFDPARLTVFGRAPARVLLRPRDGAWPSGPLVLSVESAGLQRVVLETPGLPVQQARLLDGGGARRAFGRLAFDLPQPPAVGAPLRLRVDATGTIPSATTFAVRDAAAQAGVEARWLAFATACLVTMLVTAVTAVFFGLRLRDAAFGHYAAYVTTYALIQATQAGYVVEPLGWHALAATVPTWGRAVTTLSVVAAVLFLDRFVELRDRLPRMRRVLHGYCGLMLVLVAVGYVPALQNAARALINPMLILGGPLLLGTALAAAWRGSRYALIFLLGWVPLLAVTVLASLQLYGIAAGATWTDDAAFAVGAFEALVLSLGLAERAASVRRQRDHARLLARTDPLTGVLNRRAWRDRMQAAIADDAPGLAVLYLDLDHFKAVNDRLGHEGGDRVLKLFVDVVRRVLREQDVLGRYGGEEFVVGLVAAGPDEACAVAERVRAGLRARAGDVDRGVPLSVSVGVAARRPGEALDALLGRADAALYEAKRGGRDRVVAAA